MFPLKDNIPTSRFPLVTVILIALNIAVFGYQLLLPDDEASTPELARAGVSERDELANLPRLSYALRVRTGVYQGEAALVADPNEDGIPSARAALSVGAYGPAEAALTSDIIYEGAAAVRILNWHLSAYGQPQRRITYLVSPRLADLDPGALVQLTDADLYLTDRLATVVRRGWADGALEIELLLHPDDSL